MLVPVERISVSPVFVGRSAELAELAAALRRAGEGQPQALLIAGDAGVGKPTMASPKGAPTGPAYQEAITINADTGIPLKIAGGAAGQVTVNVSYVVTRVSLASIASGNAANGYTRGRMTFMSS